MKLRILVSGVLSMSLLVACNGDNQSDTTERPEKITDEPLMQQETESDTTLQEVEEVTIKAVGNEEYTMLFDTDTLEVEAGSMVRLDFINEGTDPKMIYNIVFTKPGMYRQAALQGEKAGPSGNYLPDSSIMIAASPVALPGQTVRLEFKAPDKPGAYDFVSTYPGHHERMNGKLLVK